MKEQIFKDQVAIDRQLSELSYKAGHIQEYVDKYNKLGIGNLDGNELTELFRNSKEFVSKKLTGGGELKIGNLTANPEKLLEIADKPIGLDELLLLIQKHNSSKNTVDFYKIELYSIENDKVVVSQKTITEIEAQNTVYIENNEQKEIYAVLDSLVNNLNKLKAFTKGRLTFQNLTDDYIKRGEQKQGEPTSEYADFVINMDIIKKFK